MKKKTNPHDGTDWKQIARDEVMGFCQYSGADFKKALRIFEDRARKRGLTIGTRPFLESLATDARASRDTLILALNPNDNEYAQP